MIHERSFSHVLFVSRTAVVVPGSAAHAFINAPLVLDYMELKWTCTVPSWSLRNPLDYTINEGFYTFESDNNTGKHMGRASVSRCLPGLDGSLLR